MPSRVFKDVVPILRLVNYSFARSRFPRIVVDEQVLDARVATRILRLFSIRGIFTLQLPSQIARSMETLIIDK